MKKKNENNNKMSSDMRSVPDPPATVKQPSSELICTKKN